MNNFLNDPKFQDKLREAAALANRHVDSVKPVASISLGDAFLFAESKDLPVRWVAVRQHKDNSNLWYLVAADDCPLVGTCDVELAESNPASPLVIRCGVGMWALEDDVDFANYLGQLEGECILDAQDRLSEMVRGDVPITARGSETDSDPDYEDWLEELASTAAMIEHRLQSEPVVLSIASFTKDWTSEVNLVADQLDEFALAADTVGKTEEEKETLGRRLDSQLPGKLFAVLNGDEISLQYEAINDEDRPPRVFVETAKEYDGDWESSPGNRWLCVSPIAMADGEVTFRVGAEKFTVQR